MPTPIFADFGPLDVTLALDVGKLDSQIGTLVDVRYREAQTVLVDLSAATPRLKDYPDKSTLLVDTEIELFDTDMFYMDMKMIMDKNTSCGGLWMAVDELGLVPRAYHSTDGLIFVNMTGCVDEIEDMMLSAKTDGNERLVKGPIEDVTPWFPPVFGYTIPGRDSTLDLAFDTASRAAVRTGIGCRSRSSSPSEFSPEPPNSSWLTGLSLLPFVRCFLSRSFRKYPQLRPRPRQHLA